MRALQKAIAAGADLRRPCPVAPRCRKLMLDADCRSQSGTARACPRSGDVPLEPITDVTEARMNVLHVAAAVGSPALVEYIWQVSAILVDLSVCRGSKLRRLVLQVCTSCVPPGLGACKPTSIRSARVPGRHCELSFCGLLYAADLYCSTSNDNVKTAAAACADRRA